MTIPIKIFPLLLLSLISFSVNSQTDVIYQCAKSAASPEDPDKWGEGIAYKKINGKAAVSACLQAHQQHPNNGLVNVSLSRAYNKLGDYNNSFKYASIAINSNYPFAYYWMGIHYTYGDGVKKNEGEASRWYEKAGHAGVAEGSRAIANNLRKGEGVYKDLTAALLWAEKAIQQGSDKAYYNKGLILEDQATAFKDDKSRNKEYIKTLKQAYTATDKAGYHTSIKTDKDLARINKKIEMAQPVWAKTIPAVINRGNGDDWRAMSNNFVKDGTLYRAVYTNVGDTVFALWHAFNKNSNKSQWFVDFDYRGSSNIDSIESINVDYDGDFYSMHISNTDENMALSEMSTATLPLGYRAVGKIDFRSVELLLRGTELSVRFWDIKNKSNRFRFGLNSPKNKKTSKATIEKFVQQGQEMDPNCCNGARITPFTWDYWHNRKICEGVLYYTEKTADKIYWFADDSRSQKEKERYKKEQTERCAEVEMPLIYKKPKKPIRIGDMILTPRY